MTVLSRSLLDEQMVSVQCDVCCPPLMATNHLDVLRTSGWRLAAEGADDDTCPACVRDRAQARDGLRRHRGPGSPDQGRLPNLVVIGAAKCGTTSLHAYLDTHPEVAMAELKELRYFQDPDCEQWAAWYRAQFDPGATIAGESSTMYTRSPALPGVAERMAAAVPGARLIYMVRDPVDRAVASYLEERFQLLDPRPVEEAFADLDDPYNPYLSASRYAEQLEEYLRFFPREQVLVLPLAELETTPDAALARVFAFLGVDPTHVVDTGRRLNEGSAKYEYGRFAARMRHSVAGRVVRSLPEGARTSLQGMARRRLARPLERPDLTPELRAAIAERLAPDAARFRELTGLALADWSV